MSMPVGFSAATNPPSTVGGAPFVTWAYATNRTTRFPGVTPGRLTTPTAPPPGLALRPDDWTRANYALLKNWKYARRFDADEEMAEIGKALVVPPPAVVKLPAPSTPPELWLVDPMIPKLMFAMLAA